MTSEIRGVTPLPQVFDMVEALAFYRDRLGFDVGAASPEVDTPEGRLSHWMWLRRDGANIMLNTAYDEGERPGRRDKARWVGHADAGLFFDCADVDALYVEQSERGVTADPPQTAPYGMRQLYVRDPDNYVLCFQQPA